MRRAPFARKVNTLLESVPERELVEGPNSYHRRAQANFFAVIGRKRV
jgi:hypothetical protein